MLVTGPHAGTNHAQGKQAAIPGHPPQGRAVGGRRLPSPGSSRRGRRRPPPPGSLLPPRQHTTPAQKSVRCGVGCGPPHPHPPHQAKTGSRPRSPAPRTGGRKRNSAQPVTPLAEARGPPLPVPSYRLRSADRQLPRAYAMGLVVGPNACSPKDQRKRAGTPARCSTDG